MMKAEFEERINEEVSNVIWDTIHTVYQFHPSIDDAIGKSQITMLYTQFGMTAIEDMLPRAQKIKELEQEKQSAQAEIAKLSISETV